MNFVHIVGRLAKDPETRFTSGGQKVTVLIVATNSYRAGNEETIWWRVTLWGDRWDKMVQHFSKGKPIMVGGEMRKPEMYTDKNGTHQVGSIELTADYVKFVPFGRPDQEGDGQQGGAENHQQGQRHDGGFGGQQYGGNQGAASGSMEHDFSQQDNAEEEPLPF